MITTMTPTSENIRGTSALPYHLIKGRSGTSYENEMLTLRIADATKKILRKHRTKTKKQTLTGTVLHTRTKRFATKTGTLTLTKNTKTKNTKTKNTKNTKTKNTKTKNTKITKTKNTKITTISGTLRNMNGWRRKDSGRC